MDEISYNKALNCIHTALTPYGFLASITEHDNYKRIWTRDGVIVGLAALETDDNNLIQGIKNTLNTIAEFQGLHGEIPSNINLINRDVSYGGLVGRVDNLLWYIIGVCSYVKKMNDKSFLKKHSNKIEKALFLAGCWEFNSKGFIYMPISGYWADEYILHGYTLLIQTLYYFALKGYGILTNNRVLTKKAVDLKKMVEINYWITPDYKNHSCLYHPTAYERILDTTGRVPYYTASFSPGGYVTRFDGLANSLILLSDIGTENNNVDVINFGERLNTEICDSLVPSYYPPIMPDDREWEDLENNYRYRFKNYPYAFSNGGLWPMITGFWVAGLCKHGKNGEAKKYQRAIGEAIKKDAEGKSWGFYEFINAKTCMPQGTRMTTWSASAAVMSYQAIINRRLPLQFMFN